MFVICTRCLTTLAGYSLMLSGKNIKINYLRQTKREANSQKEVDNLNPIGDRSKWDYLDIYHYFLQKWKLKYCGAPYDDDLSFKQRLIDFEGFFDFCGRESSKAILYVDTLFSFKMDWVAPPKIRHLWNPFGKYRHKPERFLTYYIIPLSIGVMSSITGTSESNVNFDENSDPKIRKI